MDRAEEGLYPRQARIHSGSLVVAIPPQIYRALGWAQGNWLCVRQEGEEVVVSRVHLGRSREGESKHKLIPQGKHGKRFRAENEAGEP